MRPSNGSLSRVALANVLVNPCRAFCVCPASVAETGESGAGTNVGDVVDQVARQLAAHTQAKGLTDSGRLREF